MRAQPQRRLAAGPVKAALGLPERHRAEAVELAIEREAREHAYRRDPDAVGEIAGRRGHATLGPPDLGVVGVADRVEPVGVLDRERPARDAVLPSLGELL